VAYLLFDVLDAVDGRLGWNTQRTNWAFFHKRLSLRKDQEEDDGAKREGEENIGEDKGHENMKT